MSRGEFEGSRGVFRRARVLIGFFLLLMACVAAPGLADDPPAEPQEVLASSAEVDPEQLPGPADVTAGIERAEEEEARREQWLASPEALQQREASLTAFADLPVAGAEALLGDTFFEQLQSLNSDPARYLSDAQLLSASEDPTAGTVKEDGDSSVLDAEIPLRIPTEDGDLQKVDLSLEQTAEGFETKNALVDVVIPDSAAGAIEVGQEDVVEISQEGAAPERDARRFGDENVFYPDVLPDTDMLVSPIAGGVEIFNQLRSENSPETFRFEIDVPEGGTLRASGVRGAEVVAGDEKIAHIPQATAVDAQGTVVPVEMVVEGDSIVLRVDHRDGDYAMPILLDPILENNENWIYGQNHNALDMGVWGFNKNVAGMYGSTNCIYHCFGQPSNVRGLFVSAQSGTYFANQFAQWSYAAPNAGFIDSVTLSPYVRYDHADCNAATTGHKQPHDYFGIWGNGTWNYISINSANYTGHSYTLSQDGRSAIFGLGSGGGNFSIPCWRDLYAGGAHVWLDDSNWPWFNWLPNAVKGIPGEWVSNETPFTITSQISDAGLGIKNAWIHHDGGPVIPDVRAQDECAGTRRSPCLTTHTASFDAIHGGYFFEGERDAWLTATDATGKGLESDHWTMRVDNEPPQMTLAGQLAEATEDDEGAVQGDKKIEILRLPVYKLEVKAEDYVSGAQPKNLRSGVENIEIFLDGVKQEVPWSAQTCNISGRCPPTLTKTYSVALSKLTTSGKHVLKVVSVDQVGKQLKQEMEFEYFPATGMKDEYVMHYFPLPDGQGNEGEEEHPDRPELAVNVMNGNLVYRETDIDVESTAALDLEVERYYNSMLPDNEQTEWGEDWTLAQTPELDPIKSGGSSVPNKAEVLDSSGVLEGDVGLPTAVGASKFDPMLQTTLTKKESGGYELTDETGESPGSISFDASGQTEALLDDGYAKVDYDYEGGELAEIEVSDPATFSADPAELEIPEPQLITEPTYSGSFGVNGSGDGQLKSPADTAVDAQGNLWVVDKSNNRIQKFDPTGKFLLKFGSAGTGNGQFNRPTAITIAANGDLLVTDAGNSRVQRFSSTGVFISKFGSKGTANGQFAGLGPESLALDAAGNIWVSDTSGGRIQKFSSTGTFLQSVGTKGSAPGQLGEPTGIDVDSSGKVWVADWQNHRVSIFSPAGEFLSSFGSFGAGDGQFKNPDAIEVDNLGGVWVGDASNHRVQLFDLTGQFKAKFGSTGSGAGQFNFNYPMGIAADSKGSLWVTDVNNHRIQHWLVPVERPAYVRSFGSAGSGDGQLAAPADVALGVEGNLWVIDASNNRIQRFDKSGKYLGRFGSLGSGNGQFNRPTAIAIDRDGNLLVADSKNNRVQKFDPQGQFLAKFGSGGSGNGQFSSPEGIATDLAGNIWVADSGNGRIQRFNEEGEFRGIVGSKGLNPGQLYKPVGVEVDSEGRVWVVGFQTYPVSVFEPDGDLIGQFGGWGAGVGQFSSPSGIEIDGHDNVWVVDQGNGRVQRFDLDGLYVGQFGSKGSGEGQFSPPSAASPAGIASDRDGRIWVSDANNNRVQQWMLGHYETEAPTQLDLSDGDPKVEVETEGDLVVNVSGNAAGTHSYEHEGDFLTSHQGPEGETLYEKNPAGLMSEVKLPNGTWATITYYADKRVSAITVAPHGVDPKTTHFYYQDGPPRRSFVTPPSKPQITYDIGADGSVLKWWHKAQNPEFLKLDGNLANSKEAEISAGDLTLDVSAYSPHGLASIQIIANGDQLVSEQKCNQDLSTEAIECLRMEDLWVTDTASLSPGILTIEVIVTDRFGDSVSEHWWVKIPHTPPPVPGYPVPPKFGEIQKFREDYGLEVVFPVTNERELAERIFGLINAWHSPLTPTGEVARSSWERWGVPLRPVDVAELEYREWYVEANGPLLQIWGEENYSSTYAGYWVDHRHGGLIRIGFVGGSSVPLDQLKSANGLVALDRLASFSQEPSRSMSELISLQSAIAITNASQPPLGSLISRIGVDIAANKVTVGATNVPSVVEGLAGAYGASAPFVVDYHPFFGSPQMRRWDNQGPAHGGQMIVKQLSPEPDDKYRLCTGGFGAQEKTGTLPNGQAKLANFVLTAGHCFEEGEIVKRVRSDTSGADLYEPRRIGEQGKRRWKIYKDGNQRFESDGAAVKLDSPDLISNGILARENKLARVDGAGAPVIGQTLCVSLGRSNAVRCQPLREPAFVMTGGGYNYQEGAGPFWQLVLPIASDDGDSGSPVWSPRTSKAIGINVYGPPMQFTPLLPPPLPEEGNFPWHEPKRSDAMGLLNEPFMGGGLYIVDR